MGVCKYNFTENANSILYMYHPEADCCRVCYVTLETNMALSTMPMMFSATKSINLSMSNVKTLYDIDINCALCETQTSTLVHVEIQLFILEMCLFEGNF